jgi:hypothetical protein
MGAGTSVPDVLDEAAAKELAGEYWSQELFDSQKDSDGKVTKAQFEEQRAASTKKQKKQNEVDFCEEWKSKLPQSRDLVIRWV